MNAMSVKQPNKAVRTKDDNSGYDEIAKIAGIGWDHLISHPFALASRPRLCRKGLPTLYSLTDQC